MRVYLVSTCPLERSQTPLPAFEELAGRDRFGIHHLAVDPESADLILFIDAHMHSDWKLTGIRNHPLLAKYREKAFIYDERDHPWCALPGVYVSMPKSSFDSGRMAAYSYYTVVHKFDNFADTNPDILFSFLGARSHKVRRHIFHLSHPRALIEDTSRFRCFGYTGSEEEQRANEAQRRRYAEVIPRSKFVLCPRGHGTSSIRLYEVMAAGRVPVIISDDWIAPDGPSWQNCSIRIGEREVSHIPDLLEANESRFEVMAQEARREYDTWFSSEVMFHRLVESCLKIQASSVKKGVPHVFLDREYRRSVYTDLILQTRKKLGRAKRSVLGQGKA